MAEEKSSVIVAVFQDMAQARQAYDTLRSSGYGDDYLGLADPHYANKRLGKELAQAGVPDSDSQFYQHEFDEGHPLVTVRAGGLQVSTIEKARNILKQNGAYDANSGRNAQQNFGSNVKTDAKTPFYDIAPGVPQSEKTDS